MERHRHHLRAKKASWRQGVRPPGATRHVGRPSAKKEAAKGFRGRKKTLPCSLNHHYKTACRLRRRREGTRTRLRFHDGLQ